MTMTKNNSRIGVAFAEVKKGVQGPQSQHWGDNVVGIAAYGGHGFRRDSAAIRDNLGAGLGGVLRSDVYAPESAGRETGTEAGGTIREVSGSGAEGSVMHQLRRALGIFRRVDRIESQLDTLENTMREFLK